MDINDFDEKFIRYIARQYARNYVTFDDLVQEGYLAVLTSKKKEHKYNNIRQAIRQYAKKERQQQDFKSVEGAKKEEIDYSFIESIDSLDTLKFLLRNTQLSPIEHITIEGVYLKDQLNFKELSLKTGEKPTTLWMAHDRALKKLIQTARKEEHASR